MASVGEIFESPTMKSRMTFLVTTERSAGETLLIRFDKLCPR
jgi:hypothetical protein